MWRMFVGLLATTMCLGVASVSYAQSRGVVTTDRAIIWRIDTSVVAAIVDAGVELTLMGRSERWFEVVVPERFGGRGETGLIATGQVRLVPGSELPPVRSLRGGPPAEPSAAAAQSPDARPILEDPPVAVRAFGQGGIVGFSARKSIEAVTGSSVGPTFGGGAQVRFRPGLFAQVSLEQYRRTGERVYVFDGESFPLGIASTLTVRPLIASVGYRPPASGSVLPYVGVGIGRYQLLESALFEDPDERVDETHVGYHAHIGVEFRLRRWLAPAAEVRYSRVPDALGSGGASLQFDEHDLGGWQVAAKILVGP
jgi:opacity protein-like surface antigen